MKIGTLGAGEMTAALVRHWTPHHTVRIAGRSPEKAQALAERVGAQTASLQEVAESSDIVLMAVRWEGVDETLTWAGADEGRLSDKVVIDCGNPVEVEHFTLTTAPEQSLAQRVADRTGARVVKAFNLCHASVWEAGSQVDGHPVTVPLAADDPEALELVGSLVHEAGGTPIHVGGLEQAAHLEATAAMVIRLLFGGADLSTTFQLHLPGSTE